MQINPLSAVWNSIGLRLRTTVSVTLTMLLMAHASAQSSPPRNVDSFSETELAGLPSPKEAPTSERRTSSQDAQSSDFGGAIYSPFSSAALPFTAAAQPTKGDESWMDWIDAMFLTSIISLSAIGLFTVFRLP